MKILSSYNVKWLIYTVSFFLFFTGILLVSQYYHEKKIRIEALEEELDSYARLAHRYVTRLGLLERQDYAELDMLSDLLPNRTLRITLINPDGTVLYDSQVPDNTNMENHLFRPEIQKALKDEMGSDIRVSKTTGVKYYYYARRFDHFFTRVSVMYEIKAKQFIQPDRIFLVFVIFIFLLTSVTVILITDKFGRSVNTLREFTLKALTNKPIEGDMDFPSNELGMIGQDIIDIYQKLIRTQEELLSEKAKLMRHLNMQDEGIAIFSKDRDVITNNNHFIQFINHISDTRILSADELFSAQDFAPLLAFIEKFVPADAADLTEIQPTYESTMSKGGKIFSVRSFVFPDKSFEVSIQDITKPAKRKVLKQQMTENIAHELKTPVSSIKGFLETILNSNPPREKAVEFIRRAYAQSSRLAELINDISLLTKIEEAGNLYLIEQVNLIELISDIEKEVRPRLDENDVGFEVMLGNHLELRGSPALLHSVFINLIDNAITHGGKQITVRLEKYMEDSKSYYFSFSDSGAGVPEADLPRLFERFYRVDKGRDRKRGGTGLGLAIVKNAVQFHRGDISVKNRTEGGLEFLFTLSKDL